MWHRLWVIALASSLTQLALAQDIAQNVWQITYFDKRKPSKTEIQELERLYGCRVIALPYTGDPPKTPERVSGIVLHTDPDSDPAWVLGQENPSLDTYELHKSLSDRWAGENFLLSRYGKSMYPETHLASEYQASEKDAYERLERIRARVIASQGKSILKLRAGFGSDGNLPMTSDNWGEIYRAYLRETKPRIEKLKKTLKDGDRVQAEIADLPHIKGMVLEQLIKRPDNVIVQTMVPLQYELRVHVIQGKVLNGATSNRFDFLGKYLPKSVARSMEKKVQTEFLDNLPAKYKNLSATMDIVVSGREGYIVDLNPGVRESGMYDVENDLLISNLLVEHFSGKPTPFLSDLRAFQATSLSKKAEALKGLVKKYATFVEENETSGFWNSITDAYFAEIERKPTSATFAEAMKQMYDAGLRSSWEFHAFAAEVADRWASVGLNLELRKQWVKRLRRMEVDGVTYMDKRTIKVIDEVEYSDHEAMLDAAEKIRAKENPAALAELTVEEIAERFRKGVLKDFYTWDRLKTEQPDIAWAEDLTKAEGKAIFIDEGTFLGLTKAALRRVGFFNGSRLTEFSRKAYRKRTGLGPCEKTSRRYQDS